MGAVKLGPVDAKDVAVIISALEGWFLDGSGHTYRATLFALYEGLEMSQVKGRCRNRAYCYAAFLEAASALRLTIGPATRHPDDRVISTPLRLALHDAGMSVDEAIKEAVTELERLTRQKAELMALKAAGSVE